MSSTQNDSQESKLALIDDYAQKIIKTEKDITRQVELLKLWTKRDLSFSIGTDFAFKII